MPLCGRATSTTQTHSGRVLVLAALRQPEYLPWLCRSIAVTSAAVGGIRSCTTRVRVHARTGG
jgi:hypothetical protein